MQIVQAGAATRFAALERLARAWSIVHQADDWSSCTGLLEWSLMQCRGSEFIHQRHHQRPSGGLSTVPCSLRTVLPMAAAWFVTLVAMGGSEHPSMLLRASRVVLRCPTVDG